MILSGQSAFEIQYLYEVALDVFISNCNFEGLSKKYNNLNLSNLPYDVLQKRIELNRKRLSNAYFLYAYLDLGQRYCIPNYFVIDSTLDDSIMLHKEEFMRQFWELWSVR